MIKMTTEIITILPVQDERENDEKLSLVKLHLNQLQSLTRKYCMCHGFSHLHEL